MAAVGIPTLALLWLAMAVTIGNVFAISAPEIALLAWNSAAAHATLAAEDIYGRPKPDNISDALASAKAALAREAVNASAAGTIGLAQEADGHMQAAERSIAYAERLSRRETPVELRLIQRSVDAGDIAGALVHYNRALSTDDDTHKLLLPVLVQAAADPNVAREIGTMLARRPRWWSEYLLQLIPVSQSPVGLARIVAHLRLNPGDEGERSLLAFAIFRLTSQGAFGDAMALYRQATPGTTPMLRNGSFSGANPLPPLDWALTDGSDLGAYQATLPDANDGNALFLQADNGRGGQVAQQLLLLAPGNYTLSATVGQVPSNPIERPSLRIACATSAATELISAPFPAAADTPAPLRISFAVPASGCQGQLLSLSITNSSGEATVSWIKTMSVSPS